MKLLLYILGVAVISFISTSYVVAQKFADKEYYLVDSLELDSFSASQRTLLDSCLNAFYTSQSDTVKFASIIYFVDNNYEINQWDP